MATRWYRAPELCGSFYSKVSNLHSYILLFFIGNTSQVHSIFHVIFQEFCIISKTIYLLQYTPAVDMWSIGCIFAEMLTKQPLFPGDDVVHQLDLITDLLGSPSTEVISRVCPSLFSVEVDKLVMYNE